MAILKTQEMPRTGEWRFGESPELTRRFIITVDTPGTTTPLQCAQAVGVDIGVPHPQYPKVPCVQANINEHYEESPYHIEFIARYNVSEIDDPNPLLRPSIWKFETYGQSVPALSYYSDDTDPDTPVQYNQLLPLTNSAYDYFQGLTTDEAYQKVTIRSNISSFPVRLASEVTNRINNADYLFGAPRTWKCQGITAEDKKELVGASVIGYWEVTVVLLYRETGWDLRLPDMGFNYLFDGQKRRVMTFDFENAEWVPSPVPMGLDGKGAQTFGAPAILRRRVYNEANFYSLFGSPPVVLV